MQKVIYKDLGLISYKEAWELQQSLLDELVGVKQKNRQALQNGEVPTVPHHYLLFCQHPPVYTLGKSGSLDNLLLSENELEDKSIEFFKINRGGDITFHGPGQIVGYPIFDLDYFFTDVHRYVRFLEEIIIRTLQEYNIEAVRSEGFTGVWLAANEKNRQMRKICAIGVHLSRWVTMHGFAFNINPDLDFFNHIIPCGINEKSKTVTSLAQELGKNIEIDEVKMKLKRHFSELFQFEFSDEKGATVFS